MGGGFSCLPTTDVPSRCASSGQACAGVGGIAAPTTSCARSSSARSNMLTPHHPLVIPAKAGIQYPRDAGGKSRSPGVLDRPVKPGDDSCIFFSHRHTSALPPENALAVASSLASSGNSISLCALPDEANDERSEE